MPGGPPFRWVPANKLFRLIANYLPIHYKILRPVMITMTKEQFNPKNCIQALYSNSTEYFDSKFTTKINIQKVIYDKTNPFRTSS